MTRESEFRSFAAKHELTDARLDGDKVFISVADYWKWANRAAASFVRPASEFAGFLHEIDGFQIYVDAELAGTGLTVASPQWLTDALQTLAGQDHEEGRKKAWIEAISIARRNCEGFVVRSYNIITDHFDWQFGNGRWPRLIDPKTSEPFTDDPMRDQRDDVPVAEFMTYLNDWYFPQRKALHWMTPEKADV